MSFSVASAAQDVLSRRCLRVLARESVWLSAAEARSAWRKSA